MKCYTFGEEYVLDETFDGNDFKDWWGSPYIQAGQARSFGAGLPSRNDIHYRDHIFTGVDDDGNEAKGTIRVRFPRKKRHQVKKKPRDRFQKELRPKRNYLLNLMGFLSQVIRGLSVLKMDAGDMLPKYYQQAILALNCKDSIQSCLWKPCTRAVFW